MNSNHQDYNLSYLKRYFQQYVPHIVLTILFLIVSRVAATAEPYFLKRIIDFITQNQGAALANNQEIIALLGIYFLTRTGAFIFDFLRDYFLAPVQMGVGRDVARDLFQKLLRLPISYHHDQKTGSLARRIARGAQSINFLLDFAVINILPTLLELLFVTGFLIYLYPVRYGVITFLTVVLYAIFTVLTTEIRQKYRLAANVADDEASGIQIETVYNIETVKIFGNEQMQQQRFADKIKEWFWASVRSNQLFAAISAGQSLILTIGFGVIIYFAISEALAGVLTIGDLVLLTTYVVRLAVPISALGFVYRRIKDGITDLSEMSKIFYEQADSIEAIGNYTLDKPRGQVSFRHVEFDYKSRPALRGLTLDIPAGKRVAIVGPSGAGKSTIVRLLFRLYRPKQGSVCIDEVSIFDIKKDQYYDIIALVPQESMLFNDTIEQNIRFGKPEASQKEIEDAVRLANLTDLIKRLPDGLNTVVGERGVKLSGGEKQRVAIARAVVKQPKILVFDEATSNLDAEAEQEIIGAIRKASAGRTTISIAHRLSTIIDSDIIFVIDKGKLVESGTHKELLESNGLYARLWATYQRIHQTI